MQDMLVRLLELPDTATLEESLAKEEGVIFKRPIAPEKHPIHNWVRSNFSQNWADELETAFYSTPVNCFIAQREQTILGFACFECTAKNFFGPTGVLPEERGKGIGRILLVKALQALKNMGYTYAIIGGVGPATYYKKVVHAQTIEHSEESIYQNLLKPTKK